MTEIIYKQESFEVMGACFEVHNEIGVGFLEEVYHECLKIEFDLRGIPFVSKKPSPVTYKGRMLETVYKPDFICFNKILLEIKAVAALSDIHRAKVLHYLRLSGIKLGLLVNFHQFPKLDFELRVAL